MHERVEKSPSKATAPVQSASPEMAAPDLSSAPTVSSRPESIVFQRVQALSDQFALNHAPLQLKENTTGMPDQLKSGIESLSGVDVSDVQVHFNSSKPAQLNAHAYAQGNQIHVAPQQEKHLPHEAWHVVQQKQGRVKPTAQLRQKVAINDDSQLEREADVMGAKAMQLKTKDVGNVSAHSRVSTVVQRLVVNIAPDEYALGQERLKERSFSEDQTVQDDEKHGDDTHDFLDLPSHKPPKKGFLASLVQSDTSAAYEANIQANLASVDVSKVGLTEPVIFAGHGIVQKEPVPGTDRTASIAKILQGYTENDFAKILKNLPDGYEGTIYLQGCQTATGVKIDFSDSLAQKLFKILVKKYPKISVKGNMGDSVSRSKADGGLSVRFDSPEEGQRMIANYKQLYQPLFDRLAGYRARWAAILGEKPPAPPYGKEDALVELSAAQQAKSEELSRARSASMMATFIKASDRTAEQVEQLATKKRIEEELDVLNAQLNALQAEKDKLIADHKATQAYQEWLDKKNALKNDVAFVSLRKIEADMQAGAISFFNPNIIPA